LAGGSNGGADSGTVSVTVNGYVATQSYGASDSAQTVASGLTSTLNASSSPVSASLSGATITLTSKLIGSGTNYSLSASETWNTQTFTSPSFSASLSGSNLAGGSDGSFGTTPLVTLYSYDALDHLICAVQKSTDITAFSTCAAASAAWRPRSFVYDSLSRLTSATNPESGNITYTYDANGYVLSKTSPMPNKIPADTSSPQTLTISYSYDALNRVTLKTYSDGATPVRYGYDGVALTGCTLTPPTITDTNPVGRRTSMCSDGTSSSWALDITSGVGWKTTEKKTIGSVTQTITAQSNFGGVLYQTTYPSGRVVTYGASGAGSQTSAVDSTNAITYAQNATYAPFGGLLTMTNGSGPITVTNAYNERLQPVTLSAATGANTLFSKTYDFHRANGDNGNVFQVINNLVSGRSQSFTYDALNRIVMAQSAAASGSQCWGESYTIDNWANLTNKNVTKCSTVPLNAPASTNNQISGYCYDKAGNLLGTSACPGLPYTPAYTYDEENRLKTAGGVTYTYDGDGRRVRKNNGTLYWGNGPLAESDLSASATSWKEYIFFNGTRIARRDASNSSVHYIYSDYLGSSSVITNATGTLPVEEDLDYFPYGGIAYGAPSDHYEFTGKERDSESGLDYFGARYDSSTLGRFMTPDSIAYSGLGDPQSLNLYSYVGNHPTSLVDPDGHCWGWAQWLCNLGQRIANKWNGDGFRTNQQIDSTPPASDPRNQRRRQQEGKQPGAVQRAVNGYFNLATTMTVHERAIHKKWNVWMAAHDCENNPFGGCGVGPSLASLGLYTRPTVRVGRWMSKTELEQMRNDQRMVESTNNGISGVTVPPNPDAYKDVKPGEVFVEFDLPEDALQGYTENNGWAKVWGPSSIFAEKVGITEMPPATNIEEIMEFLP
jgi:RHS repeat-associated protein